MMKWFIVFLLFCLGVIDFADKSVAGFSSVPIMEELGLSNTEWGTVGSSFFWLYAIGGLFLATWSDKLGTKKTLLIMAGAWTVLQFGAYAITGLGMLIGIRVLLGFFEGAYYATVISQMSEWVPMGQRALATSIINAGSTVGSFVSAPVLVAVVHGQGWRHAFGLLGILSLIWIIIWVIFGREKPKTPVEENKMMTENKPKPGKSNWKEVIPVLRSRTFILTLCAYTSFYWFLSWTTTWMPNFLTKGVGLTPSSMGTAMAGIGIVSLVVTIGVCVYSDRIQRATQRLRNSRVYVMGTCMMIASIFFASIAVFHSPVWVFIALCMGKGLVFTTSSLSPQIMMHLMPERKGFLIGLMVAIGSLAAIVGPWVTGVIIDAASTVPLGHNLSILCLVFILLVFGALFTIFVNPDRPVKKVKDTTTTVAGL